MRKPQYLSFSALNTYERSPEEYALRYLTDIRPPREPQSQAAAAGSAFDAYEKSHLDHMLFGGNDPRYEFETLFEAQVEAHNRDWAIPVGKYLQESYKYSGMHDELIDLLNNADDAPRFEFDVNGVIEGVPINGKPDCELMYGGLRIVLDWKVMGFMAKNSGVSPAKGYRVCKDGYNSGGKPSRSHGQSHSLYVPQQLGKLQINTYCLEDSNHKWADQLAIYGWTLGDGVVGDDTIYMIDQLVCRPMPKGYPLIRVANFRARIRDSYQRWVAGRLKRLWAAIESGHIFQDLSREESDEKMEILNEKAKHNKAKPESVIARFSRPVFRG